ncbi:MAG: hypothetical protein U0792_13920 [Gemmataceae bacterium]
MTSRRMRRSSRLPAAPSGLRFFIARLFRETHHADVLENWGKLWMWHSLMILPCSPSAIRRKFSRGALSANTATISGLLVVGLLTWGTVL